MRPESDTDVLIIGAGPGGSAAAITALNAGLRVVLLEQTRFPRHRPGETLHPGIQPLLAQLGVEEAVLGAGFPRFEGIWIEWGEKRRFEAFGRDEHGAWRGFQAWRETLDRILRDRAVALGAEIHQPCRATGILKDAGGLYGLHTTQGQITARHVVDASGPVQWLATQLDLGVTRQTSPLYVRYGYVEGRLPELPREPILRAGNDQWLWLAPIGDRRIHWARLCFSPELAQDRDLPEELIQLASLGSPRGADVTWRAADRMAGPGFFLVGDAAFILDPTSSHGVLRAMMSGIHAASLAVHVREGKLPATDAAGVHHRFMERWYSEDAARLRALYKQLESRDRAVIDAFAQPAPPLMNKPLGPGLAREHPGKPRLGISADLY